MFTVQYFTVLHTVPSAVSWHLLFLSRSTSYSVCVATTCLCRCSARLWRCPDPRRRPQRWVKTFIIACGVEERVERDIHSCIRFKVAWWMQWTVIVYVHNFIEISSSLICIHFLQHLTLNGFLNYFLKNQLVTLASNSPGRDLTITFLTSCLKSRFNPELSF